MQFGRRHKILADREKGGVVDADEICRANCQLIIDCREELLAIPQIVAAQVATMTEPHKIEALILGRIEESLERLANGRQRGLVEAQANEQTGAV